MRVIGVTSGKGGVGKTTVSVNLAVELAKRGKKVVLLDGDLGLSNAQILLNARVEYSYGTSSRARKPLKKSWCSLNMASLWCQAPVGHLHSQG